MDKYSKNKLVMKRNLTVLIILFFILLVLGIMWLIKVITTDKVIYENIDRVASNCSEDEARNSTPIIVNNIVIGGVYNSKWVDALKYYEYSKYREETEVDVFNSNGKNGTFVIDEISNTGSKYDPVYVKIIKNDYISEYYAVAKDTSGLNLSSKIEINEENEKKYLKSAKKALSKYNYMNSTMKLQEAYNVTIDYENRFTLLFVTNDGKAKRGVYSAIVAVSQDGNDSMCVKYNYYKDINNAPDFEIYSFKLSGDLNSDKKSEIIVQGTKEFTSTYYVLELYNGKFRQILQSSVNIQ